MKNYSNPAMTFKRNRILSIFIQRTTTEEVKF